MIQITDRAREKIDSLVQAELVREPALRIGVGDDAPISPMDSQYQISLVEREDKEKTEIAINVEGIRVLLNLDTSTLLSGATIDWSGDDGGFSVETPRPRRPERAPSSGTPGVTGPLADRVQRVLDEAVNPRIAMHGGSVELVDVTDDTIYVRMNGGCQGCSASAATLRMGVERMVKEEVPEIREIIDLTDHNSGENPYY